MMTKLLLILMVVGNVGEVWGEESSFLGMLGLEKWDIKVFTKKYPDGEIKEEYQYYTNPDNNRRVKHGWYNYYYPNGEYKEVGTYKDNEKDGEWSYFTEDGKETKGIWKDEKKDSGEFWINVKIDDGWVETENDTPDDEKIFRGLFTYEDGLWNGLVIVFWTNGNKKSEGLWSGNGGQGRWVSYYESGKVKREENFVNGKHEGKWVDYHESGEVMWKKRYVNGKQEGKWVGYYESGKVMLEVNFVDGKQEGKWVLYNRSGNIKDEDIYKDGVCVEKCEGNE